MKRRSGTEDGFTLAALIVMVSVLAIMLTAAAPVYRQQVHRELEEELIFRGEEYVRAILKYQRQFGVYPPDLESLLETNGIRFLRRAYVDPITGEEFRLLTANPAGGIEGSVLYPSGTTPLFESGPLINSGANSGGIGGIVGPQSEGGRGGGRGGGGLPGSGFQSGFGESSALDSSRSGGQSGGFQSSFGGFEGGGFGSGTGGGGQGGLGTSGGFAQPAGGGGQGSFGAPGGFGLGTGGAGQGGFGGRGGQGAEGRPAGFAPPGTFPQSGGRGGQGEGGRGGRGGNAAGGFGGGVNEFTQIGGGGVPQGAVLSGLVGVAPVNEAQSIKFYNGRNVYYEWEFLALPQVLNPQNPLAAPDLNSGQPPAFNQGQAPSSPGTGFNSFGGQP